MKTFSIFLIIVLFSGCNKKIEDPISKYDKYFSDPDVNVLEKGAKLVIRDSKVTDMKFKGMLYAILALIEYKNGDSEQYEIYIKIALSHWAEEDTKVSRAVILQFTLGRFNEYYGRPYDEFERFWKDDLPE